MESLCDTYIEAIKPVMRSAEEQPEAASLARNALWYTLDTTLKLMHPFMPFVTEELWQRLPGRPAEYLQRYPSIMVAPYPDDALADSLLHEESRDKMGACLEVCASMRSLAAQFKVSKNLEYFVTLADPTARETLSALEQDLHVLGKAAKVLSLGEGEDPPPGCAMQLIDAERQVHLMLKGLVDPQKEIAKLQEQVNKAEANRSRSEERLQDPNFMSSAS